MSNGLEFGVRLELGCGVASDRCSVILGRPSLGRSRWLCWRPADLDGHGVLRRLAAVGLGLILAEQEQGKARQQTRDGRRGGPLEQLAARSLDHRLSLEGGQSLAALGEAKLELGEALTVSDAGLDPRVVVGALAGGPVLGGESASAELGPTALGDQALAEQFELVGLSATVGPGCVAQLAALCTVLLELSKLAQGSSD